MAERGLSGSPAVNPRPGSTPIKDRAIHHKNLPSKTVREIITESIEDTTQPKPVNMSNHVNGMRRMI